MRKEYNFSKSKRNPYIKQLKTQITIRLDSDIISHFKQLAQETGIAYQVIINLFLKDCATNRKKLFFKWDKRAA